MSSEPVVRLTDVHVTRGGRSVLRGLDFEVAPGEVFALLGGNGAGKSTTLLTCLGLIDADRGTVEVLGASPRTDGERIRRSLAYLPEQAQLYPELDAYENLGYFLELAAVPFDRRALDEALDTVSLQADARTQRLETYSKGMRQKVAIALALLRGTPLLLLDEPTSGLDPLAVDEFDALVHRLGDAGIAVLMVTHDLYGATRVASRLGLLREGRLSRIFERDENGIDAEAVRSAYASGNSMDAPRDADGTAGRAA
ncbi:MAG: ABC transporter ATP-binding protein [Pseudomonadales bacterium]|jgi:ABC-2 type transport system ATP-binding protein|nr:ABC transporter ATP-binding protein [Pseudomonadales bacterium]